MTANIVAQHYEMQGPVHYDVLEANGPATECQDYEVPQETKGRDEADKDDYIFTSTAQMKVLSQAILVT